MKLKLKLNKKNKRRFTGAPPLQLTTNKDRRKKKDRPYEYNNTID
jgi:hypothetical protein